MQSMKYQEFKPPPNLSEHIECYWELIPAENKSIEVNHCFVPDCTYDIILSDSTFYFMLSDEDKWSTSKSKAVIFGLHSKGKRFKASKNQPLFGIRIKSFALYSWLKTPLKFLQNKCIKLSDLSIFDSDDWELIDCIIDKDNFQAKTTLCNEFFTRLRKREEVIDQKLRSKINYILDNRGLIKIKDMYEKFNISKYSLQREFNKKIGMNPKLISRIWRFNYFLQIQMESPDEKINMLGLDSGYYDQAHLIKDFKYFLNDKPYKLLNSTTFSLPLSQKIIQNRFNNNYDPMDT